jgi:hypothetical protein
MQLVTGVRENAGAATSYPGYSFGTETLAWVAAADNANNRRLTVAVVMISCELISTCDFF